MKCVIWVQSNLVNLVIRNFLVALKLFLNAKCSLYLWSKLSIGNGKWFLNTNFKTFLITKFDCSCRRKINFIKWPSIIALRSPIYLDLPSSLTSICSKWQCADELKFDGVGVRPIQLVSILIRIYSVISIFISFFCAVHCQWWFKFFLKMLMLILA